MNKWAMVLILMIGLTGNSLAGTYSGGSGTEADPYQISDPNDLLELRITMEDYNSHFILTSDIDMEAHSFTTAVINGDFSGVFDGVGYKISNLTIDTLADTDPGNDHNDNLGLFANTEGLVKNLTLADAAVKGSSSSNYLGSLCAKNSGTIRNCYSTGSIEGKDYLGGLCGYNNGGTITNCHASNSITGRDKLGGLCGFNYGGTISRCYAAGSITGYRTSGGLCGFNSGGLNKGTITGCYAVGSITGRNDSSHLGGLCGINGGNIQRCYAKGSVTGGKWSRYFGGLCGETENGTVSNCYATGNVTGGEKAHDLGGLCGFNQHSSIINCYSTGSVTSQDGSYNFGGFCGVNLGEGITNSFWDTDTSGTTDGIGNQHPDPNSVTGLTSPQMKIIGNFIDAGWDFNAEPTWRMCKDDFQYPLLAWEFPVADFICPDGVDMVDFAILSRAWLSQDTPDPNWNKICDLNDDSTIDPNDLQIFAEHWLETGEPLPPLTDIVWVTIDDSGEGMVDEYGNPISHGGFTGQMSKYLTTNAQYCKYLNIAIADGKIVVYENTVYASGDPNHDQPLFELFEADSTSQITYSGSTFSVRYRDGYDMNNHPVTSVSWYGATAFCNYYGYRLPTCWEWQAVADYDGSYIYGCGTTIDPTKANYYLGDDNYCNPIGLSRKPYTNPVYYYPAYGYGMNDMAGNVLQWTNTESGTSNRIIARGGGWDIAAVYCTVSTWSPGLRPSDRYWLSGFRVCR